MTTIQDMNLDYMAAKTAAGLFDEVYKKACKVKGKPGEVKAEDADNLFTKTLGVVQESGPFAGSLYLLYRSGETQFSDANAEQVVACHTLARLLGMPHESSFSKVQKPWKSGTIPPDRITADKKMVLEHMLDMSNVELERLLLIKQLWEQTLTYARYIARSRRERKIKR